MKRQKTGGRQKGTPNKFTSELKDLILGALDDAGGQDYLRKRAIDTPSAFLALLGKVLPVQAEVTQKTDPEMLLAVMKARRERAALEPTNRDAMER